MRDWPSKAADTISTESVGSDWTSFDVQPAAVRALSEVATLEARGYYDAHRDLISVLPVFNLYNQGWPIRTAACSVSPTVAMSSSTSAMSAVAAESVSSAYRSLHINTSREAMEYAAWPMPASLPDYPGALARATSVSA